MISGITSAKYNEVYLDNSFILEDYTEYYRSYLNVIYRDGNNIIGIGQVLSMLILRGAAKSNNKHFDIRINKNIYQI